MSSTDDTGLAYPSPPDAEPLPKGEDPSSHATTPWPGRHEDGRSCSWHQRLGRFVFVQRLLGQDPPYRWWECTRRHPDPGEESGLDLTLVDEGGLAYPQPVQDLVRRIVDEVPGMALAQGLIEGLREALRASALGVEIHDDLWEPSTCRVTRGGRVVFDGVSRDALTEREPRSVAVAQNWLTRLPVQQQSVALLALRGPDGMRKDHPAKALLRAYRATVLNAASLKRPLTPEDGGDKFMDAALLDPAAATHIQMSFSWAVSGQAPPLGGRPPWHQAVEDYLSAVDEVPHHYHLHLMHGAEVVGYHHPDTHLASIWRGFYERCCDDMHLPCEDVFEMNDRLDDFGTSRDGRQAP